MANEIDKQLEEAAKSLKPAFKQVIDTLAESNKEFAVTAANFRNSTRDSFAGALTANKLKNTLEEVAQGLKEGEGEIAGIDFGEFKKINDKINALEEQRAKRLETANKKGNVLYKARVAFEKAEAAELEAATRGKQVTGAALEKLRVAREEAEKNLAEKTAQQTKSYDENIEREKQNRKEYQDQLDKALEEMQKESMEYMENMSGAFKKLTGIDLMGAFDSMVENVNAIGTLFTRGKNTDIFGDMVSGIQNIGENISNGLAKAREGAKTMATNLMASGKQFIKQGKKFAISAGLMIKGLISSAAAMVTTGVSLLAAALGLSVPALLIAAVALALVAGAIYLYNESEGFRNAVDSVVEYFMDIIEIIGNIFGGFYDFFVGLFTGDFEQMFQGIKDIFGGLFDIILTPFRAIGDFFRSVFDIDIGKMLRGMAEKILPGWLVNRLFGEETSEPPMEEAPANVQAMQRGSQQALTSEEIDNLSPEEQVKLGYAKTTMVSGEDGKEMVQIESTDKYQDVLRSEGVTSGGGFTTTATGSTAQDIMMADPTRAAELKAENQAAIEANRSATNQAVVTTVNNQTTNASNTTVRSTNPTPRDTDPTGSRLSAVPA